MNQNPVQLLEIQLTIDPSGHFLNQRQAFSPDDKWLVYDTRNDETKIGENASIQLVNVETKEVKTIYKLENQTAFGPGTGAVSFHPSQNKVVFIHGLMNASEANPYGFTRRFAMQVDLDNANKTEPMEARDVNEPFTKGALRGGSHAYSYRADGHWVSFTYNDQVLALATETNPDVQDLRTVGAFIAGEKVAIDGTGDDENFDGNSFAILLAEVKANPAPGSDEISKAYEEGWVGKDGYTKTDGSSQKVALAFLGDVLSVSGEKVTEVFIADVPDDILSLMGSVTAGSKTTLPSVPKGVKQRRLTFTTANKYPGVQGPRQWMRCSPDGDAIYFYQKDDDGIVQIYSVSPNGGEVKAITSNDFSADTTLGLSADGKYLAYGAKEAIYVTAVADGKTTLVLPEPTNTSTQLSNINWSNSGQTIAYNRQVALNGEAFYQIFVLDLTTFLKQ
ncbi:DUF3748 domain-containing protein [Algoriphagus antarcticus]|uniref:Uncharacterized protein DUF3748 n=1 Tax=Algoriphagus antarcticus TaxID=238540 RepID=A0A3E0DZZ0_9BACT|nr:DUF3748 domain-containing protein [Algoriphagus antarcticus]REG88716.1 uncharacterized protein DUF3748 [Algoriphagus antarcticus]